MSRGSLPPLEDDFSRALLGSAETDGPSNAAYAKAAAALGIGVGLGVGASLPAPAAVAAGAAGAAGIARWSSSLGGKLLALKATRRSIPHLARTIPSTPPLIASSRLSVIICLTIRVRLAPSAVRNAISLWRDAALTNSKLATFAQAINSTKPTAASRMKSVGLVLPTSCSFKLTRRRFQPVLVSGYCSAIWFATASVSA